MWISKISQRQTKTPIQDLQGQLQLKLMLNIKQKGRQSSRPLFVAVVKRYGCFVTVSTGAAASLALTLN